MVDSAHIPSDGTFPQTEWGLVLDAQQHDTEALSSFCSIYWKPLYSYARMSGWSVEDSEDLIQSFFIRLLEDDSLSRVQQDGRKMRSFLLHCLKNLMRDQLRHNKAAKRGGAKPAISFDFSGAENEMALLQDRQMEPEQRFDQAWARRIMELARERVAASYAGKGKTAHYAELAACLTENADPLDYAGVSETLGMDEAGARYAAYQLRQAFRRMLIEVVKTTLPAGADPEEELAHLKQVFVT